MYTIMTLHFRSECLLLDEMTVSMIAAVYKLCLVESNFACRVYSMVVCSRSSPFSVITCIAASPIFYKFLMSNETNDLFHKMKVYFHQMT